MKGNASYSKRYGWGQSNVAQGPMAIRTTKWQGLTRFNLVKTNESITAYVGMVQFNPTSKDLMTIPPVAKGVTVEKVFGQFRPVVDIPEGGNKPVSLTCAICPLKGDQFSGAPGVDDLVDAFNACPINTTKMFGLGADGEYHTEDNQPYMSCNVNAPRRSGQVVAYNYAQRQNVERQSGGELEDMLFDCFIVRVILSSALQIEDVHVESNLGFTGAYYML